MSLKELTPEQLRELSMIDMAFYILDEKKQAVSFLDIWNEIVETLGLGEEEAQERIAQFYTDLNIDGRFVTLGENRWGLRTWYPVDQIEDDTLVAAKTKSKKKKKAKKLLDDEFEDYEDFLDDEDLDVFDDDEDYDEDDEDEDYDEFDDEEEDFLEDDELDEFDDEFLGDEDDEEL